MVWHKYMKNTHVLNETLASLKQVIELLPELSQAQQWLAVLEDRFANPHRPWLVGLCGPTGAGKSYLTNLLAQVPVSPSSYRRPSTVAPVLVGSGADLEPLKSTSFFPGSTKVDSPGGVSFEGQEVGHNIFMVPIPPKIAGSAQWQWPGGVVLIDSPDFDSVRQENQAWSQGITRRADAIVLVVHQPKYADQSVWDFLTAEAKGDRPFLLVLSRFTAPAAQNDFQARLNEVGIHPEVVSWPDIDEVVDLQLEDALEDGLGNVQRWLSNLKVNNPNLPAQSGRKVVQRLGQVIRQELGTKLQERRDELAAKLFRVQEVSKRWQESPRDFVNLSLPGETRTNLLKSLDNLVKNSDLWATPRNFLGRHIALVKEKISPLLGMNTKKVDIKKELTQSLTQVGQEALVVAVRDFGHSLAEASGLTTPQVKLDFASADIRAKYDQINIELEKWLHTESQVLLAGLPFGQKAAFYIVQFTHLGLVGGLWVQTGGIPGAEVLVGGALGPVISKITGVIISREQMAAFEEKAARHHHEMLSAVFKTQGQRYEELIENELAILSQSSLLEPQLVLVEQEAKKLWG